MILCYVFYLFDKLYANTAKPELQKNRKEMHYLFFSIWNDTKGFKVGIAKAPKNDSTETIMLHEITYFRQMNFIDKWQKQMRISVATN